MAELISLKQNKDFKRMFYRSKSLVNPALVIYYMKNRAGFCRLGITTGKKIGNAVTRNRAKRVIREAFRSCSGEISGNYDFVIVARHRTAAMKSTELAAAMHKMLCDGGIIKQ